MKIKCLLTLCMVSFVLQCSASITITGVLQNANSTLAPRTTISFIPQSNPQIVAPNVIGNATVTVRSGLAAEWSATLVQGDYIMQWGTTMPLNSMRLAITNGSGTFGVWNFVTSTNAFVYTSPFSTQQLPDLTDVELTSVSDGDALIYDAGSGKWINGSGSGGPAGGVTSAQSALISLDVSIARTNGTGTNTTLVNPTITSIATNTIYIKTDALFDGNGSLFSPRAINTQVALSNFFWTVTDDTRVVFNGPKLNMLAVTNLGIDGNEHTNGAVRILNKKNLTIEGGRFFFTNYGDLFLLNRCTNIVFRNTVVSGKQTHSPLLRIVGVFSMPSPNRGIEFDRITISNAPNHGVVQWGSGGDQDDMWVHDSYFYGGGNTNHPTLGGDGTCVVPSGSINRTRVYNNYFNGALRGVEPYTFNGHNIPMRGIEIVGNVMTNMIEFGIFAASDQTNASFQADTLVANNRIHMKSTGTAFTAGGIIMAAGSTRTRVVGNIVDVSGAGGTAIGVTAAQGHIERPYIAGNTVMGVWDTGVQAYGNATGTSNGFYVMNRAIVENNDVELANKNFRIGGNDSIVRNNTAWTTYFYAFQSLDARDTIFENNISGQLYSGVFRVEATSTNIISRFNNWGGYSVNAGTNNNVTRTEQWPQPYFSQGSENEPNVLLTNNAGIAQLSFRKSDGGSYFRIGLNILDDALFTGFPAGASYLQAFGGRMKFLGANSALAFEIENGGTYHNYVTATNIAMQYSYFDEVDGVKSGFELRSGTNQTPAGAVWLYHTNVTSDLLKGDMVLNPFSPTGRIHFSVGVSQPSFLTLASNYFLLPDSTRIYYSTIQTNPAAVPSGTFDFLTATNLQTFYSYLDETANRRSALVLRDSNQVSQGEISLYHTNLTSSIFKGDMVLNPFSPTGGIHMGFGSGVGSSLTWRSNYVDLLDGKRIYYDMISTNSSGGGVTAFSPGWGLSGGVSGSTLSAVATNAVTAIATNATAAALDFSAGTPRFRMAQIHAALTVNPTNIVDGREIVLRIIGDGRTNNVTISTNGWGGKLRWADSSPARSGNVWSLTNAALEVSFVPSGGEVWAVGGVLP